jgi:single-strand DNA-binding protein
MALNKVILIGRPTKNPDIRYSNNNNEACCIARLTLAVDRRFAKNGEQSADFINCVAFGKTGEFIEKYIHQGTKIAISGRIQTGSYTNKDGQKVYTTDIVIEECEFAESKKSECTEQVDDTSDEGFMNVTEETKNNLPFKQK